MSTHSHHQRFELTPHDNRRLADLCGQANENFRQIEAHLAIEVRHRGHLFELIGSATATAQAQQVLEALYADTINPITFTPDKIYLYMQEFHESAVSPAADKKTLTTLHTKQGSVKPRNQRQQNYVNNISQYDINFGIGPAGTGKTYLAVACAIAALRKEEVSRIILVRPAVEAGEHLGFLPGDYSQKIDPYLRPLFDALYEMLGTEQVIKYMERNTIELAPLAYMRGRTLNDAFIILDEAQNTTKEQMKMFLTRLGFGSKAVITGDITQVDLPRTVSSGLRHATQILEGVPDICFNYFKTQDVVRHPIVQKIVEAYEKNEKPVEDRQA